MCAKVVDSDYIIHKASFEQPRAHDQGFVECGRIVYDVQLFPGALCIAALTSPASILASFWSSPPGAGIYVRTLAWRVAGTAMHTVVDGFLTLCRLWVLLCYVHCSNSKSYGTRAGDCLKSIMSIRVLFGVRGGIETDQRSASRGAHDNRTLKMFEFAVILSRYGECSWV